MEKHNAAGIVDSTALLSQAFSAFFGDESVGREVAFNLADIEPELLEIHTILQEIKKTGKATRGQVETIIQAVCIHWKYHGEEIRKLIDGLGNDRDEGE